MFRLVALLIAIIIGCGPRQLPDLLKGPFAEQVRSFIVAAQSQNRNPNLDNIIITFSNTMSPGIIGLCYPYTQPKYIFINTRYWSRFDPVQKELVIWHELGHCALGRDHLSTTINGHPVSIMFPDSRIDNDEAYYLAHHDEFVKELFSK